MSTFTPTPFILKDRYTKIECPLDGYDGLWFEVRMNLSNGELQALRDALHDLDEQAGAISELALARAEEIDERRNALPADDTAGRRACNRDAIANRREMEDALTPIGLARRNLVAPYIRAWNFYEPGPDGGEPVPLPPPKDNPDVLAEVSGDVVLWLCREVLNAYTGGQGFGTGSAKLAAVPEPGQTPSSGGPQIREPSSPSQRRQRKSSGPKA